MVFFNRHIFGISLKSGICHCFGHENHPFVLTVNFVLAQVDVLARVQRPLKTNSINAAVTFSDVDEDCNLGTVCDRTWLSSYGKALDPLDQFISSFGISKNQLQLLDVFVPILPEQKVQLNFVKCARWHVRNCAIHWKHTIETSWPSAHKSDLWIHTAYHCRHWLAMPISSDWVDSPRESTLRLLSSSSRNHQTQQTF